MAASLARDLACIDCGAVYALGYRPRDRPVALRPTPIGALDPPAAVERVLARLAAGRSAWNAADIRGEVEPLIAAAGVVSDAAVRIELAEDLTARALACCVPLLPRDGVPQHIRAWTSARSTTRTRARTRSRPRRTSTWPSSVIPTSPRSRARST